jgi:hypothetical protein
MSPSASTALTAISQARTYLNDESGNVWPDSRLMPILTTAHNELSSRLIANGVAIVRQQSQIITVPPINPLQTPPIPLPNQPSNMVFPISMQEKQTGSDIEFFIDMSQMDFVPMLDPVEELGYWAWIGQQIMIIGATVSVDVLLRYRGTLIAPVSLTDSLGFILAELFLGPRVAALAYMSSGDQRWKDFDKQAQESLSTVIGYNVAGNQGVGKRRMAYRRGGNRRIY